jgi:hypothetical protein
MRETIMRNILSSIPFVLCNLMAADAGAAAGGGNDDPPDPDAPPTEEPKPEGGTVEAKLTSATGLIGKFFSHWKNVHAKLQTATSEQAKLQGQFDAATAEAAKFKAELATMTTNRDTEKTRADSEKTRADRADGNVTRLESLCQLRGIDPNAAVAPAAAASEKKTMLRGDFDKLSSADQRAFIKGGGKLTNN